MDLLGHVNNSRYIEWLCDAFPLEVFRERRIEWLQVNYEREVRPGEQAAVLVNPVPADPNLYAVEGRNLVTGERAFEAALRWTG